MAKFARLALLLTVAIVVAAVVWWSIGRHPDRTELTLYGNVDLRQVELPFNGSERIAEVRARKAIT